MGASCAAMCRLILAFELPKHQHKQATRPVKWADDDSTVYSTEEPPADACVDMFSNDAKPAQASEPAKAKPESVPFHIRAQQELAKFAQNIDAQQQKRVR